MARKAVYVGRYGSEKKIEQVSDTCTDIGIRKEYKLSTAITSGVTDVPSDASDYDTAMTSHATGRGVVFYALTGVWVASDATAALPVKATGAEVNTGTDDAKFVTPKAVADSTLNRGNTLSYLRTATGASTVLGGNPTPRQVIIVVKVVTSFAAGDGAAPVFNIGETGTTNKFRSNLNTGTAGDTIILAGTLSGNAAMLVTSTAATGTTSTGAIDVSVVAVPDEV